MCVWQWIWDCLTLGWRLLGHLALPLFQKFACLMLLILLNMYVSLWQVPLLFLFMNDMNAQYTWYNLTNKVQISSTSQLGTTPSYSLDINGDLIIDAQFQNGGCGTNGRNHIALFIENNLGSNANSNTWMRIKYKRRNQIWNLLPKNRSNFASICFFECLRLRLNLQTNQILQGWLYFAQQLQFEFNTGKIKQIKQQNYKSPIRISLMQPIKNLNQNPFVLKWIKYQFVCLCVRYLFHSLVYCSILYKIYKSECVTLPTLLQIDVNQQTHRFNTLWSISFLCHYIIRFIIIVIIFNCRSLFLCTLLLLLLESILIDTRIIRPINPFLIQKN